MAWKPSTLTGTPTAWPTIDAGTLARTAFGAPGVCRAVPDAASQDELTPIADYMAGEFNTNSSSEDARRLRALNSVSLEQCLADFEGLPMLQQLLGLGVTPQACHDQFINSRAAAMLGWAWKVRQDGDWDHKPRIAQRFNPRNPGGPQHWHRYQSRLYYYDVWSNLHYGYVGAACGFDSAVLLDGAGVEQVGSNWLRGQAARASPGVSGMRAYDNPEDRYAIEQGVRLYGNRSSGITAADLVTLVVRMGPHITTKPYVP